MRLLQEYENDYRADLLDGFVNSPFKGGDRLSKVGFIKDWRQELESDIWLMPPMYHRVWQWIKYSTYHSVYKIPNPDGSFTTINPGQCPTSYRLIAKGVGYYEGRKWKEPNVKTVKSILDWLVKQNMISVQSNSKGTIINVVNWGLYQSEIDKGNSERNADETLEKHLVDTKKNDKECYKNEKNDKEDISICETEEEPPKEEPKKQKKPKPKKDKYGEFEKVSLTDDEFNKLINSLGQLRTKEMIARLDTYKASTGKRYSSDYATILNWQRKDIAEGKYDDKKQQSKSRPQQKQSNLSELLEMINGGAFDNE